MEPMTGVGQPPEEVHLYQAPKDSRKLCGVLAEALVSAESE